MPFRFDLLVKFILKCFSHSFGISFPEHNDPICDLESEGRHFVSSDDDGTIITWKYDGESYEHVTVISGKGSVHTTTFNITPLNSVIHSRKADTKF